MQIENILVSLQLLISETFASVIWAKSEGKFFEVFTII